VKYRIVIQGKEQSPGRRGVDVADGRASRRGLMVRPGLSPGSERSGVGVRAAAQASRYGFRLHPGRRWRQRQGVCHMGSDCIRLGAAAAAGRLRYGFRLQACGGGGSGWAAIWTHIAARRDGARPRVRQRDAVTQGRCGSVADESEVFRTFSAEHPNPDRFRPILSATDTATETDNDPAPEPADPQPRSTGRPGTPSPRRDSPSTTQQRKKARGNRLQYGSKLPSPCRCRERCESAAWIHIAEPHPPRTGRPPTPPDATTTTTPQPTLCYLGIQLTWPTRRV
jgi:hypothetical protein